MTDIKEILALASQSPRADAPMAKAALERIVELEKETKFLHIKLAGETLRADQGWERYEYANKSHMAAIAAQSKEQG
jgi:hypothetical protein